MSEFIFVQGFVYWYELYCEQCHTSRSVGKKKRPFFPLKNEWFVSLFYFLFPFEEWIVSLSVCLFPPFFLALPCLVSPACLFYKEIALLRWVWFGVFLTLTTRGSHMYSSHFNPMNISCPCWLFCFYLMLDSARSSMVISIRRCSQYCQSNVLRGEVLRGRYFSHWHGTKIVCWMCVYVSVCVCTWACVWTWAEADMSQWM